MPMYCATKKYNLALSKAMQDSYSDKIDVMTVTPASVITQMNPGHLIPFSIQAPDHAKTVIDHLGWHKQTWGSALHYFQFWLDNSSPISPIMRPMAERKLHNRIQSRLDAKEK